MKKILYWAPRILSIALVAFISLFSLDVFSGGYTGWELVIAIIMHLLPVIAGTIVIIIAWKRELMGGILFIILGVLYIFLGGFETMAILIFTLPFLVIGSLLLTYHFKFSNTVT